MLLMESTEHPMKSAGSVSDALQNERGRLLRSGTAERVTEILREQITGGLFEPGVRLSEESIGEALGVSRNTLREAFRLLSHERLVVHELHRGVFVRALTAADVSDLYLLRHVVEGAAVRSAASGEPDLSTLIAIVEQAEAAATAKRWSEVATFDLQFHQELVGLAGSPRLNSLMQRLLAELRLAFHVMSHPGEFHEPYLLRNRSLVSLLQAGKSDEAAAELQAYLEDAEAQLLHAFGQRDAGTSTESKQQPR
jgi:DNA-binding GntR family transcriptional regulator